MRGRQNQFFAVNFITIESIIIKAKGSSVIIRVCTLNFFYFFDILIFVSEIRAFLNRAVISHTRITRTLTYKY